MEIGLIVSDVQYAIWYQRGKPFANFAQKLSNLRQQAVDTNDESLASMVKVIANASYGKLGQQPLKARKHFYVKII